jgi:3-deoxy-D-manno-octulosonic acid kinase
MTIQIKIEDNQYIIYHQSTKTKSEAGGESKSELKINVKDDLILVNGSLFDPSYLLSQQKVYKQAIGRGQTYFFKHKQQDYVLRHYWRGGLTAKVNADFYFWNPFTNKNRQLQQTRAYKEFSLLISLNELKLPAPKPIAARISSFLFGYKADIITATLNNTQSLVQLLNKNIADSIWFDIGQTIAKFHRHNVYHDDLNANNILIDESHKIFIIDFDKGKIVGNKKIKQQEWKNKNLQRLLRSLKKEKSKNKNLNFTNDNWQELLKGYQTESH